MLEGLVVDQKMARRLVDILGYQATVEYLHRQKDGLSNEGEFVDGKYTSNADVEIYAALLDRAFEKSPEFVLDTVEAVSGAIPPGGVFSRVLAQALVRDDPRLLNRMKIDLGDGERWTSLTNSRILIDSLLAEGLSLKEILPLLGEVGNSSHFADFMIEEYFDDSAAPKTIDLESEDGLAVLSYLRESSIIAKERYIREFIKRNTKEADLQGE